MRWLRWSLIVPLGVGGACLGFLAAALLHDAATRLCPAEHLVSGVCTAPWFNAVEQAVLSAGGALGAVCAVVLPAWVAPTRRVAVARAAWMAGSAYALWGLLGVGAWAGVPVAVAIAAGAWAAVLVAWWVQRGT